MWTLKIVSIAFLLSQANGLFGMSNLLNGKYHGCFSENTGIVKIMVLHKSATGTLSTLHCSVFCFNNGYKYAATKNGTECHCGDLPENYDESVRLPKSDDEGLCNVPCVGEKKIMCGGENAISLFSTGIKEYEIRDTDNWKLGCFNDSAPERFLPQHKMDLIRTNTPERCMAYCKALGYPYAGVQYKVECHCGEAKKIPPTSDGCVRPCAANPQINCGGNWRIMVFLTKSYGMRTEVELDGCYKYNDDLENVKTVIHLMTPEKCVAYCMLQGLSFAHIHSDKCMCGNTSPNKKTRVPFDICNMSCHNSKRSCGGEHHMVTYKTGTHGDASLGKLISCFKDYNGNLLNGITVDMGLENSVPSCMSKCLIEGYAYAGIRNKSECICSQANPPTTIKKMVPDFLCSSPCENNELQSCGGEGGFMSFYRTGLPPSQGNKTANDESKIIPGTIFDYNKNNQTTDFSQEEQDRNYDTRAINFADNLVSRGGDHEVYDNSIGKGVIASNINENGVPNDSMIRK